jgi:6-pyruvoyltetrahydropterin/6-carboxytetrahydropterin synthase
MVLEKVECTNTLHFFSKTKGVVMYTVTKRVEIAGSHRLDLPYASKCTNIHGHNWIINVSISGERLDEQGMLLDFTHIKEICSRCDHVNLNDVITDRNTTAENIAKWIYDEITKAISTTWTPLTMPFLSWKTDPVPPVPFVDFVSIQESEGNIACYRP